MATGSLSTKFSKFWYASGSSTIVQSAKDLANGTGYYKNSTTNSYTLVYNGANFESIRNLPNIRITGFSLGVQAGRFNTTDGSKTIFSFRIVTGMESGSSDYSSSITDVVMVVQGSHANSWHYYTQSDLPELLTWINNNLTSFFNGYTTGSFGFRGYARYAQCRGITLTVDYSYTIHATGVTLSSQSLSLNVGSSSTLTATVTPSDADNKSVTWSTSKSSVATVSNGVVTAVGKGTANITATTVDGGYTATCSVTVTQPVTGVSLNTQSLNLNIGSTSTLTATVSPSNANNKNVTWSSNNTSVATVSNGTVTAVSSGTATITVTTVDGGYTATCTVTVQSSGMSNIKVGSSGVKKIYIGSTEIKKVYLGTIEIYSNG